MSLLERRRNRLLPEMDAFITFNHSQIKPVNIVTIAIGRDLTRVGFQPVLAFAVFRRVPNFTTSCALLLEQEWARYFRAKLGTAFRVMRLSDHEWEFALLTKLTETASHLCRFGLGRHAESSRKVGFFFVFCTFCFCFVVPYVLVSYRG